MNPRLLGWKATTIPATHLQLIDTYFEFLCHWHYFVRATLWSVQMEFQDGAKMSKIPLRNLKIVFFNLLVDVGVTRDDRTNERLIRHYVTHFKRKHLDNKRRFLLADDDFNKTSEMVKKKLLASHNETETNLDYNEIRIRVFCAPH